MAQKKLDVASEYKKIWEMADELAEKEAKEFEKKPFEKPITVLVKGKETVRWVEEDRTWFKHEQRTKHIIDMLELFLEANKAVIL